ncbi:uncharacterized protein LOC130670619 isoform X2 [Microplitis mediator]|uniref:uncharacterized protein LOC130670619 isoform X2 n=1 Tax=Microplitis mediator TaxID=375433 RepID=UPI002554B013|nr:uncharacterized protein LOC130670619 isoform X2 [Microplitis mediator]
MNKILLLTTFLSLCIEIIWSEHLTVFREELRYTYFRYNLRKPPSHQILCISDNPRDAVIWNNHLEWSFESDTNNYKESSSAELSNYAVANGDNEQCEFNIDSPECLSAWTQNDSHWNSISSFDVPMGPVYDTRWEQFKEYFKLDPSHTGYSPIKSTGEDNSSYFVFHKNDALVVSIRGSANAQFLICKSRDIYRDFCYWLIIGGWHNTITAIRKCENGIPLGVPSPGSNCSILRASVAKHFPLSAFEWKTFIITWEAESQTIKLFDPDKMILSYTDSDYSLSTSKNPIYHVFYGNPDRTIPMLFRFHEYNYILTTQIEAKLTSLPLTPDHFHEICIDMLVGLCTDCELIINLIDGNATKQVTKTISSSPNYQHFEHGLPMWNYARFNASNVDRYSTPITLEIITKSNKNGNNSIQVGHWALSHFKKCLPQGTVKRLSMTSVSRKRYRDSVYNRDPYYWWPNVTCQKFSYNQQEAGVVSSISSALDSRNNFTDSDFNLCPALKIGPYCATFCNQYFSDSCEFVSMCNQHGCFCTQGHTGPRCGNPCERGWYGFGCLKSCSNCIFNSCDSYDGKCEGECIQVPDRFYIPPYCNIVIESPLAPIISSLNETSVELFVPETNKYENVFLLYIFEIKSWMGKSQIKISIENVMDIDNTKTKVYSEVFSNLTAGTEYSMQTLVTIHYSETKYKHMESGWKNFTTLCNWDKNFEIEFSERSILVNRIVEEKFYPCPDQWYLVNLSMIYPTSNKSFPVDTKNVAPQFPMLFSNLKPSTNYSISIYSKDRQFYFHQNISTYEAEPSEVGFLRAESVSSRQAVIKWYPPYDKNGVLRGYNLTIRVLRYKNCWYRHIDTPLNLMTSRSFYANHTEGYKIEFAMSNLVPYVMYEVTVRAYNSKLGLESKINFTTDELEIPTEVFSDLKFEKNIISWQKPADCTTVTGAILSARLFLIGLSENVKNFSYQVDTTSSFKIDLTDIKEIHGDEQYRVRIHVLHYPKRIHNETAYTELSFKTDPRPPPRVEKIEIVEINQQEQMMMLRWQKPLPPTNGEISYYAIRFSGKNIETTDIAYVYPNETCRLWNDSLCTIIEQPFGAREYIEVRAYNKGVIEGGDVNTVEYQHHEGAPSAPKIISIEEISKGVVDLRWKHPSITGGPLKRFVIIIKILSSRLEKLKNNLNKTYQEIEFPISEYKTDYSTHLNLLPSTEFIVSIHGVTKLQSGSKSNIQIETSSMFAFESEPRIVASKELSTIDVAIPLIINNTIDSVLYVVVKGASRCNQSTILDSDASNDFGIDDQESAWLAASFLAQKKENRIFTVGDGQSYNGNINCPLYRGVSYAVVLIIRDNVTNAKSIYTIIWESQIFKLEEDIKYLHIIWIIPLTILLIIVIGGICCFIKKRKARLLANKSEPFTIHRNTKKLNEYVVQKDVLSSEMMDHQELISLSSVNSIEEINQLYGFEVPNENTFN